MDRDGWNQRYAAKELVWSLEPNIWLAQEAADLPPGRALDVGAGEGRNAVWLAGRGFAVTAVDFAEVGLAKAARLAAERGVTVDWVLADVTDYTPPGQFDLVLIAYLHLPPDQRRAVLERARQAVAPGGTLIYIGHDLSNIEHGQGGPQNPQVLCTPQDIAAALPGFRIIKAEVARRPVAADPGHGGPQTGVALDTLVRAVRC